MDRDRVHQPERHEDDEGERQQRARPGEVGADDPPVGERSRSSGRSSCNHRRYPTVIAVSIHRRRRPEGCRPRSSSFERDGLRGGDPLDARAGRGPAVLPRTAGASGGVRCRPGAARTGRRCARCRSGCRRGSRGSDRASARSCGSARPRCLLRRDRAGSSVCWAGPAALAHRFESQAKPAAIARLATPARRRPSLAPGRLTAGDSDHKRVGGDLGAAQPGQRPPVALLAARGGKRVGGGEGKPDRPAAAEQVRRVGRGLVVAKHPQGRLGCRDRRRSEGQVEGDHVAIGEAQRLL